MKCSTVTHCGQMASPADCRLCAVRSIKASGDFLSRIVDNFRVLIVLDLTALLVSAYIDWNAADPAAGDVLDHLYSWHGLGAQISPAAVSVSSSLLFVATLVGLIGMFLLKRWGRTLCLTAMFISPLLYAVSGLEFFSAPVSALDGIATAFQVLILGMALYDPTMRALLETPPRGSLS